MSTYSLEAKETIFSSENMKRIKKECCLKNIFNYIIDFKHSRPSKIKSAKELLDNFEQVEYKNTDLSNYYNDLPYFNSNVLTENDNSTIEIRFEESVLASLFEYVLKNLDIYYEKGKITNDKKNIIFFSLELPTFEEDVEEHIDTENKNPFLKDKCCNNSILKTAFICGGYLNNPEKSYHLEILSYSIENIEEVKYILEQENLAPKYYLKTQDSGRVIHVLYIKKSDEITHFLGLIGASKQVLDFENMKIEKDFKNKITRQVNYETANIQKTATSSLKYINAINWAIKTGFFEKLNDELKEVAILRLNYPDANFRELCDIYNKKNSSEVESFESEYHKLYEPENKLLTKSGINHRLRKLYVIIDEERIRES